MSDDEATVPPSSPDPDPPSPIASTLGTGTTFAGYVVESVAGRGGMGVVYRAREARPARIVALKVVAPELATDSEFRARFERESDIAATIEHSNVLPIFRVGEEAGLLYIAMRYVEGTDLAALIADAGRLEPRRGVGIIVQVCAALDAAHARGLVHRDVKPANVLIAREGGSEHVYLTDFGIAKRQDATSGATLTGYFMGTIDYSAPEQIQSGHVDARTDVYATGCMLYHALAGRVPFRGDNPAATMWSHLTAPPPSLGDVDPSLPPQLDAVIAKAMAKDPNDRYLSAGDLGRGAKTAVEGKSLTRAEHGVATGGAADQALSPDNAVVRVAQPVPLGDQETLAPSAASWSPPGAVPSPPPAASPRPGLVPSAATWSPPSLDARAAPDRPRRRRLRLALDALASSLVRKKLAGIAPLPSRALGLFVDTVVLLPIVLVLGSVFGAHSWTTRLFAAVAGACYVVPQIAIWGRTVGARLARVSVLTGERQPSGWARSFVRWVVAGAVGPTIGWTSSILIWLVVYGPALRDPRRRALHDWAAGLVVFRAPLPPGPPAPQGAVAAGASVSTPARRRRQLVAVAAVAAMATATVVVVARSDNRDWPVLFSDDFSSGAGDWHPAALAAGATTRIVNGNWQAAIGPGQKSVSFPGPRDPSVLTNATSVRVEADLRPATSPARQDAGVFCRHDEHDDYYGAEVLADRSWGITRGQVLEGWLANGQNPAVHPLARGNRVRLDCIGGNRGEPVTLVMYVNGKRVGQATDAGTLGGGMPTLGPGMPGVVFVTFADPGVQRFDNFVVRGPRHAPPASQSPSTQPSKTETTTRAPSPGASGASALLEQRPPSNTYRLRLPQGWQFQDLTEPSDHTTHVWWDPHEPNRRVKVVLSGCVGCVADPAGGPPDPTRVVPAGVTDPVRIGATKAAYRTTSTNNPYPDNGLIVLLAHGGYAQADLWLPEGEHNEATAILNSFVPAV